MGGFVPDGFEVPAPLEGPGFRLEPLGPEHNEWDHAAWMSSIEHIHATPGFPNPEGWPYPMDLDANRGDLEMHRRDFDARTGFTWTVLDGDEVIGCVYLYPSDEDGVDAQISSWVRSSHAHLDEVVWRAVNEWLRRDWPFEVVRDHPRS